MGLSNGFLIHANQSHLRPERIAEPELSDRALPVNRVETDHVKPFGELVATVRPTRHERHSSISESAGPLVGWGK